MLKTNFTSLSKSVNESMLCFSGSEKGDGNSEICNSECKGAESESSSQTKDKETEAPKEEIEVPKETVDFKVIYNKNCIYFNIVF